MTVHCTASWPVARVLSLSTMLKEVLNGNINICEVNGGVQAVHTVS